MYSLQNNSFDEHIEIETPPFDLFTYSTMAGSCNGLLCFVHRGNILLLNPTTREHKFLKFHDELDKGDYWVGEPGELLGHAVYGLGYDSVTDEYKFVQFICYSSFDDETVSASDSKIIVHSLNDSSSLAISNVPYFAYTDYCGVYLDGALHWVGKRTETVKPQGGQVIISFDVAEKKAIREILLPNTVDENSQATLGLLRGHLCTVITSQYNFEIWVMEKYGAANSWYKLASMDGNMFGTELVSKNGMHPTLRVLGFSTTGNGILLTCAQKLFLYDPELETSRNVEIHGISDWLRLTSIAAPVASLVSLKSGAGPEEMKMKKDLDLELNNFDALVGSFNQDIVCESPTHSSSHGCLVISMNRVKLLILNMMGKLLSMCT